MSDAYCKKHFIRYCPDLSSGCPYCRIEELEARVEPLQPFKERILELEAKLSRVEIELKEQKERAAYYLGQCDIVANMQGHHMKYVVDAIEQALEQDK